ncbi:MAG: hypothetical protein KIS92_25515, partial [Planctomycetota bacterium]|nr:hypothetical protein [Planctomycetota bacterium]
MRKILGSVLVVVLLAGGILLAGKLHYYEVVPRNFQEVASRSVYRGARQRDALFDSLVDELKLKTVISLTGTVETQRAIALQDGVTYISYNWQGSGIADFPEYLQVARLLKDPRRQPVFFHCSGGEKRSHAATFAYRLEMNDSPEAAFTFIENQGFSRERLPRLYEHLVRYVAWREEH